MDPWQKRPDARNTVYLAKPNIRKSSQQPSVLKVQVQGKRSVKKERPQGPVRRSVRLEKRHHIQDETVLYHQDGNAEQSHPYPSSSVRLRTGDRMQKPTREVEESSCISTKKRRRTSLVSDAVDDPTVWGTTDQEAANRVSDNKINPIDYWLWNKRWPKIFFTEDSSMSSLLARRKSTRSLRQSATTSSDQKPREENSAPYKNPRYRIVLETKGSFMERSQRRITDGSKSLIKVLLDTDQSIHDESLFRHDLFDATCRKLAGKNETRIMLDIMRLIVPSVEILASYGATNLKCLIEGVNEAWNCSIPFYGTRPQPDYSVGFRRSAFTDDQLEKLKPLIGDWDHTSFFMATDTMHFPFLTCEVKCGEVGLDIADRQNAHSMTLAVRGVVELYRAVKREKELDGEILAFSMSHDHRSVRIYGHHAIVEGGQTTFYSYPIRTFDFTELDGRERWTAYKFTRNIYDKFMPIHLKRICSAIDQIPDLDFDISHSDLQFSQQSSANPFNEDDSQTSQASFIRSEDVTRTTSITQQTDQEFRRPRKKQR
ncbi:hypothetical protein EMCG_05160 [[Emmonsia] crescens]|uniref:DUF7924 domain-containing protein n=1 Tax=[Emmonsia] crescens TaxID=73230 RepID=A0A0G2HR18_9EURO|nr:hypothetical protein EMCG_05160 [Emmonsia crescens UAMH 3008]